MKEDAISTAEVDESVLLPSTTSDEGIDTHLETKANAESSPASEGKHEQKQDGMQKRFNKLTYEKHEALTEVDRLKGELAAKSALAETPPQPKLIEPIKAPSLPEDIYDEEAMRNYHSESAKYQTQLTESTAKSLIERQNEQSRQDTAQVQQKQALSKYVDNAIKDGVDMDKLRTVEQTLNNAGLNAQVGEYIMSDPNGAKIAEYLVDNPSEMYEVLSLDPLSAGIKISAEIKQKALSTTPNVSNAPDPIAEVQGGGYVEKDGFDKIYPGAQFI